MNWKKSSRGKTAVVTGASSGIGLCFSRELAALGCNIVMVSNQRPQLEEQAGSIAEEFGVRTYPVFLDLTEPDADRRLLDACDSLDLSPSILINNAGIFSFLPVTETSEQKIDCFIDLHVRAVTSLSRTFAMRFARTGGGNILNMSSMSCWMPMPGIAMYSATKAYIRAFSRALHYELRDSGVWVTVACPGGIATDLFGLPNNLQKLALRLHAIQSPERFTRNALKHMFRRRMQYINGLINRLSIFFVAISPTPLRMQVKRRMLDKNITRP